jgi:protein-S-isoprenylcysteine O-methyltransferase Ste14
MAVAIIAFGFSFVARAFRTFRAAGTTIDPVHVDRVSALVTSGVFGRTRNPMYVGFATMLVGWAAFLAVPWLLLGPALFVLFTARFQIVPEERAMRARFGDTYAAYASRVPRWL